MFVLVFSCLGIVVYRPRNKHIFLFFFNSLSLCLSLVAAVGGGGEEEEVVVVPYVVVKGREATENTFQW